MSKDDSNKYETNIKNLLENPIISVKEARKLLGAEYKEQSDEWVLGTICTLREMAETLIRTAISSTK